ncbi:dephospho-CoA kinase [Pricia antarctica]|uniref:Dephospho-CoA kinase n=1 Tax=Pricia antarctica TaxID=641691 RepID=A0A1G7BDQ2_9FLAO|nr:dephospho-CoA kinase [Pricia antarctica]SDE24870.1 dephospho-CoA kinase [Pricia antarctica]
MKYVGLTGGIGSGKTTVAKMFTQLGVPVYNSDDEAKQLMENSTSLKKALKTLLGEAAYKNERLNKTFISDQVFNDTSLLGQLNSIVHPAVRTHFLEWSKQQKTAYVIQEAAIIFEIGSQNFYDRIILVTAPENLRIQRIMDRDPKSSPTTIKARMQNQWKDTRKIASSDYIIENLDLKTTERQVLKIHRALLENS